MTPADLEPLSFWALKNEDVTSRLETGETGLTHSEVEKRLTEFGPNTIAGAAPVSAWTIWWRQFRSLIVGLLVIASAISFAIGDIAEGIAVLVVVVINALIGFFTELKATQSMEALKKMSRMTARVLRDGEPGSIDSSDLVPGDLVILEAGDMVPADIRVTDANSLKTDESALTGESLPIRKSADAVAEDTQLAERKSMLYRGAKVTSGTGRGYVVATGAQSELGKISTMVSTAGHPATPLEKQLDRLGYRLVWVTLVLMALMTIAGLIKGIEIIDMVQTSIALSIAAIPEGLPVVATIALANGLWKMARNNAVINQLSAVETLGSTAVICTDKTGTLTENRMTVTSLWPAGEKESQTDKTKEPPGETVKNMQNAAVLCNNADLGENHAVGDPLEIALLEWAEHSGRDIESIEKKHPRTGEVPFDAAARKMTTIHSSGEDKYIAVKGASEALIPMCDFSTTEETAEIWNERNLQMAKQGLRVIAVAEKRCPANEENLKEDFTFLGLIGLIDPPRPEISESVADCQSAGIRIVMITGDQAPTATAIAEQIGLAKGITLTGKELSEIDYTTPEGIETLRDVSIIARSTPEQKMSLVKHYQNQNHVVAMTGDGVNDAPALKQADIGVAMGLRGTDVAREAAVMVLQDDSFRSIVLAIRQGRIILANIRKFVVYLMSCNISEILVVWIAMMITGQLPLLPLQILFLNLVTDVFPALALGVTPGNPEVMKQRPGKAGQPILNKANWITIFRHGFTIAIAAFGAYLYSLYARGTPPGEAVTISFMTLAFAQLFHVFNMADHRNAYFKSGVAKNRWVWRALLLCSILLIGACYIPFASRILSLRAPMPEEWLIIFLFASLPVLSELVIRKCRQFAKKRKEPAADAV